MSIYCDLLRKIKLLIGNTCYLDILPPEGVPTRSEENRNIAPERLSSHCKTIQTNDKKYGSIDKSLSILKDWPACTFGVNFYHKTFLSAKNIKVYVPIDIYNSGLAVGLVKMRNFCGSIQIRLHKNFGQ